MVKRDIIDSKILGTQALERQLAIWRFKSKRIVFTNGCFDIIHLGHIDYLSKASELGDILIVGLNSDASVHRIKGRNRPVNDQMARATILASFSFVDAVVLFDEDTPYELIQTVQPDILVKGGDYKHTDIVGYDVVKAKGGEVLIIDFLKGYSTSSILERIKLI
jgi:rfaE bifunctional protein nucleotidyltransferase chain/domain